MYVREAKGGGDDGERGRKGTSMGRNKRANRMVVLVRTWGSRRRRREGNGETKGVEQERRKERGESRGNHRTRKKNVRQSVLTFPTIGTNPHVLDRDAILVSHPSRGGQRIVDEKKVMAKEKVRGIGGAERSRDRSHKAEGAS